MTTTTPTLTNITTYAAQVRQQLHDLGPTLVEELTDGLEADLVAAVEDSPHPHWGQNTNPATISEAELTQKFGTPHDYAAELRAAAGLPPANPQPLHKQWDRVIQTAKTTSKELISNWPAIAPVLRETKPLWSVLAVWAAISLIVVFIGGMGIDRVILIGVVITITLAVVSALYALGHWKPKHNMRRTAITANVWAIALLLVALVPGIERVEAQPYFDGGTTPTIPNNDELPELYVGGQRVTNLFIYGPDGELIDGARVLDQDGRPVQLASSESQWDTDMDVEMFWEPRTDATGTEVWNAYPLGFWTSRMANWDDNLEKWVLPEGVDVGPQTPPITRLTPLSDSAPSDPAPSDPAPSDPAPSEE